MKCICAGMLCCALTMSASAIPNLELTFVGGPQGNTYEVYLEDEIAWADADAFATSLGPNAHLATLTSELENDFVFANTAPTGAFEAWIGGLQLGNPTDPQANWFWVNSEGPIPGINNSGSGYANWLPNEPNNSGGEAHLTIGLGDQNGWNDEGYLPLIGGFIVERESVPDAGTTVLMLSASLLGLLGARRRIQA